MLLQALLESGTLSVNGDATNAYHFSYAYILLTVVCATFKLLQRLESRVFL